MNKLLPLLVAVVFCGCTQNAETEKYQSKRDNITDVRDKIKEIKTDNILIGPITRLYTIDNYLIISDHKSLDKLVHIFDKNNFNHVTSIAYKGQGPDEIAMIGHIGVDEIHRRFYISDHGKQSILSYNLDSVLANSSYMPSIKAKMKERQFPDKYQYINDTLSIALIIEPTGNSGFNQSVARWNMNTGYITPMKYKHPDVTKKRVSIAAYPEKGIYIECYSLCDLMTICDLNGNLVCNTYGPKWHSSDINNQYYGKVLFCKEYIFALYSGEDNIIEGRNKQIKASHPTKFILFDTNGNYIQTLEIGYQITDFCYDEDNNRIVMSLDDDVQFACLDLNGIIK